MIDHLPYVTLLAGLGLIGFVTRRKSA